MKYSKKRGLVAVVSMVFAAMLGTGSASATELYKFTTPSANDTLGVGTGVSVSLKSGSLMLIRSTSLGHLFNTCTQWTMEGESQTSGGAESHPVVKLNKMTFGECFDTIHVLNPGELEFQHIAGTTNATVISKNLEITYTATGIGTCTMKTGAGTDLGVMTGAATPTGEATLDLNAAVYEGGFCLDKNLFATMTVTAPVGLIAEPK